MKNYKTYYMLIKNFKMNLILISIFNLISFYAFCSEIDGIYIPQGKFDSALPTVTMRLDKVRPPVIRIAPSRPTVVLFPNQVSNCFSDHAALMTEIANPTKLSASDQGVNFSSVVFKVISKGIVNGEIPDQTVVNCQLIDSNVYPIGVIFTDTNAYSVVKLLDKSPSTSYFSFDMDGYSAIRIGDKFHKIKNKKIRFENIENKDPLDSENLIPIRKKIKTMDDRMKENYPQLKKEDLIVVENKKNKNEMQSLNMNQDNNKSFDKKSDINISIVELLEKKGFKKLKGE